MPQLSILLTVSYFKAFEIPFNQWPLHSLYFDLNLKYLLHGVASRKNLVKVDLFIIGLVSVWDLLFYFRKFLQFRMIYCSLRDGLADKLLAFLKMIEFGSHVK